MPNRKDVSTAVQRIARKCRLEPQLIEDAYPCTSLQAGLVVASLQDLGDYVSRFVFDVESTSYPPSEIRHAFEKVYELHAVLRSRVIENAGQFLQVVSRERVTWIETDCLEQFLAEDKHRSVSLGNPLARFAWIEERTGKSYMVWCLHHCQYDEWSFQLLVEDLNNALSSEAVRSEEPRRIPLSKFVKALDRIDEAASHSFWKARLSNSNQARHICPSVPKETTFRTSQRLQETYKIDLPSKHIHQPSVLTVTAWSLIVSQLSKSPNVLFGHVLSGRAFDMDGIQEVCGPTLTTVPWVVNISKKESVKDLLDLLTESRAQLLPFEQTGLVEYRKVVGVAAFDTLLSVRSSQDETDADTSTSLLQPSKLETADLNHPCSLFLEVAILGSDCLVKASYDDRWIEPDYLRDLMKKFVSAVERLQFELDNEIGRFVESLELPESIERSDSKAQNQPEQTGGDSAIDASEVDAALMKKVEKLAIRVAGVQEASAVRPETTLLELGMDSLKNMVLSRQITKAFDVSVPFKEIAGPGRNLASIGKAVQRVLHGENNTVPSGISLVDMASKHMRDLGPVTMSQRSNPGTTGAILLTGATGYLGIEVLRQCLASSLETVILLVRCESEADGLARVAKAAEMAAWSQKEFDLLAEKARIWPSDLSKIRLGLKTEHWSMLADSASSLSIKAVIHNGAKVDFVSSYADLEAANVRSTAILLDLHMKATVKPAFVFVTGGRPCPLVPDEVEETAGKLASAAGYAQTKFVSEVLVHKTRALYKDAEQVTNMSIVHPGAIIGSSATGVANTDDFIWRYVSASINMGCYVPAVPTKREWINLTPIDSVADAIVSRALQEDATPSDLVNRCLIRMGLPISQFWAVIVDTLHKDHPVLKNVSESEWLMEFEADLNSRGQQQPLFALSQLFLEGQLKGIGGLPPKINAKTGVIPNTSAVEQALRSNVRYLLAKEFFSATKAVSGVFVRNKT